MSVAPTLKVYNDVELTCGDRTRSSELIGPIQKMVNTARSNNKCCGGRDASLSKSQGRRLITSLNSQHIRSIKSNGANAEHIGSFATELVDDLLQSAVNTYFLSKTFDIVSPPIHQSFSKANSCRIFRSSKRVSLEI